MKRNKLSLKTLQVKSFVTNLENPHAKTVKGGASDNAACGGTGGGGGDNTNDCGSKITNSDGIFCAANSINPACPSEHTCQPTCNTEDQPSDISWGGG